MQCFLGLDVGSVNVKLALADAYGNIIKLDTEKITSSPKVAVNSLITRLSERFNLDQIVSAGISGSGKTIIPKELNWSEYSSSLSIASGLLHCHPDAKTIMQIGGQSSIVIQVESTG
jgi:activator of 2-hydroxyglutaryl-CoA dehydratase